MRCWSVQDDRLFWEYQGHWGYPPAVMEYDAEVIEGGEVAMIVIAVVVVVEGQTCVPSFKYDTIQTYTYPLILIVDNLLILSVWIWSMEPHSRSSST